jgi:hypothetical protein
MVNLEKLKFMNKNWPNDPIIDCKSSNLMELIEKYLRVKRRFQAF